MFLIYFLNPFMKYENSENGFSEFSLSTFLLNLFLCLINSFITNDVLKEKANISGFFRFMNENAFNFDAVIRLPLYQAQRRYGKLFCFCFFKKITGIRESSQWELFWKKDVLTCVFDWEFDVF